MHSILKKAVVEILTWEARAVLSRFKPRVIAVTGSVGKTTTKDTIFAMLEKQMHVRKSEKSQNSEIGVPLTILGLENAWNNPLGWAWNIIQGFMLVVSGDAYPDWLVLEVGADRPGDIRRIATWLKPDVAVVTGIPSVPAHIEYFKSPQDLVREKRALAECLKPGGVLIVNGDDPMLDEMRIAFHGMSTTFGFNKENDVFATHVAVSYEKGAPVGMRFRACVKKITHPASFRGTLGAPRILSCLAALAVGEAVGASLTASIDALAQMIPTPGRMRLLKGIKGSVVIDDTYNASPSAALFALDTLRDVKATRRIALIGDMLELGKYSAESHREVGKRAALSCDLLITVGFRSRALGEAALDAGMRDEQVREYEQFESARAGQELAPEVQEGDVILVKGSQGIRMEKAVYELLATPEKASELLVRQDPEWANR